MFGVGIANGKFGELLQGVLPEHDTNFLVSLPILRFSTAKFQYSELLKNHLVYPSHKVKCVSLVKKIMKYFGLTYGWQLTINSELEEGKGLGSSTADMVASARAITQAVGKNLPIDIFLRFLNEIEPSDGIMYDGVVSFFHRKVKLHRQLGYLPNFIVIGVDEGGIVDTIKFNEELKHFAQEEKKEYAALFIEMLDAILINDIKKIGTIATRSAVLHQEVNPKKNLTLFIDICNTVGALGVVVAHSGTYIGIILDKTAPNFIKKLIDIERKLKENSLRGEKFNTFTKKTNIHFQENCFLRTGSVY